MERAIELAGASPAELVAMCMRAASLLARDQGDHAAARALLERARAVAGAAGERAILASTLNDLGTIAHDEGDFAAAARYYEQARAENAALGKRLCVAMNLANLGLVAGMVGDAPQGIRFLEEGIALARAEGRAEVVPNFLAGLALVVRISGDLERACALAESGLAMAREYGNHASEVECLEVLARVAGDRADWRAASHALLELIPLVERFGSPLTTARTLECGAALWTAARPADPQLAELATRLAAAGHAARQRIGCPLSPVDREAEDRWLERARALLGSGRFRDAWNAGGAATLDQAVAALKTLGFDLERDP
jgi:tetratricopeptide (TPR) repeat protein